jgi:ribosomal protein S18 acetylase RimI-like enzyme
MSIAVRRLGPGDDVREASRLLIAFFAEEGFPTPAAIVERHAGEMAKLDTCGLFVAEVASEAVGVATASLEFGVEYGWSAEMGDLYVVPEWRGRGVAQRLVTALEAFLIDRGCAGYQVSVTEEAERRHGLAGYYRKLGFEDEGRRALFKRL